MKNAKLKTAEREFLDLVSRAVFANPFSDERARLDGRISGVSEQAASQERLRATLDRVRAFLAGLVEKKQGILTAYAGDDRRLLAYAHLFDLFHEFVGDFDELIRQQVEQGEESCAAPFAARAIDQLVQRGFSGRDACRDFAMCFQLRRAYYFVEQSLVGRSPSMKGLRGSLWNSVFTHDMRLYDRHLWNRMEDFSTLLLGETGTGKGAAASAIGRSGFIPFDEKTNRFSESFMRSFTAMNLSQFPELLIESELFGHRKGAFTGAVEAHEGVFSRCSPHGSIFLDEIGDVSIPIQIKLLQVLQERTFSPIGSHEKHRFHGRVIAASNRSIDELRREGLFRDDFFYRLCSDVIVVPSLRQRIQEDPRELDDLLAIVIKRIVGDVSTGLTDVVREVLNAEIDRNYPWPGNVRELEQCVRRIILTRGYRGDRRAVSPDLRASIFEKVDAGTYSAQDLLSAYCALLYDRHGTYEEVARRTGLDRRTVKKYVSTGPQS